MNNDLGNNSEIQKVSTRKAVKDVLKELFDWAESIILSFIAVIIILTFFARTSVVDGDSMLPTLSNKDFLIISHFTEKYDYNDIIVFWAKDYTDIGYENGKALVKRIIGLPGDKIEIDFEKGIVYRNDLPLEVIERGGLLYEDGHPVNGYTYNSEDMTGGIIIPKDGYFVMGDNRNNSADSRSTVIGIVDSHYIIGKALMRILPFDKIGSVY